MMRSAVLALLVAAASAFAPASMVRRDRLQWNGIIFVCAPTYLRLCLDFTAVSARWIRFLERRGNVQGYSFLGPTRKARWIHGWRHGIRPYASVSNDLHHNIAHRQILGY